MSDQLDMFGNTTPVTAPTTPEDVAAMVDQESARPEKERRMVVSQSTFNVMTQFLAGMMFPGAKKYEALPAEKRRTAERAAQAAIDVFAEEDQDG